MEAKLVEVRDWLLTDWSEKLCMILESMADERPVIEPAGTRNLPATPDPDAVVWSQSFTLIEQPSVWIATSASNCIKLGKRILAAADVQDVEELECRSAFFEILGQSLSALGVSISSKWECKATADTGDEIPEAPENVTWSPVGLSLSGAQLEPIWFATSAAFLNRLATDPTEVRKTDPPPQPVAQGASASPEPSMAGGSKTFDLLLDVALPVSVSFGRTFLPIKEVLRLISGSIVELDREINEPVEVIVNNCVIARGEVVVIDGNYGVRIQEIASRQDRLRTGTAATQSQHALPPN